MDVPRTPATTLLFRLLAALDATPGKKKKKTRETKKKNEGMLEITACSTCLFWESEHSSFIRERCCVLLPLLPLSLSRSCFICFSSFYVLLHVSCVCSLEFYSVHMMMIRA